MYKIVSLEKVKKQIIPPPDKSISHRALLIGSLSKGKTEIINFLHSNDTLATLDCIKKLGVKVFYEKEKHKVILESEGKYFSKKGIVKLCSKESGTTIRIISGLLVGQRFSSILNAQGSLRKRPMKRVTLPLRMMKADIKGKKINTEEYPPLRIKPVTRLLGITYKMPQPSAQVKSAILLASLFSEGITKIRESYFSRDHTERMLNFFGAKIKKQSGYIISEKCNLKNQKRVFVPGDFSSISFFIVLGTVLKDTEILFKNVGVNYTRTGLLRVLKRMGAQIKILNKKSYFEPYADILIRSSSLKGIKVGEKDTPLMIDEIPCLLVCACFAKGITEIYGLKELKVKETDRIKSMIHNLSKAGINIGAQRYGREGNWMIKIKGQNKIKSTIFKSFSDHRTAMSLIIFSLASGKVNYLDDTECIDKSFPEFVSLIESLHD